MGLTLVTAPVSQPVSLDEVKAHIGIETSDWDTMLNSWIKAATSLLERAGGLGMVTQTWRLTQASFAMPITFLRGPVTGISSIKYYDAAGTLQTLASSAYVADLVTRPAQIVAADGAAWPVTQARPDAVQIDFVTGFSDVPAELKLAICVVIANWFQNREAGGVPQGALQFLAPWRQSWGFA